MGNVLFAGSWKETPNECLAIRQEKILEQLKTVAPIIWQKEEKKGRGLALSSDREGRISYANSENAFDSDDRRINTTLQRYLRRQLNIDTALLADHELNSVCQKILKPFLNSKLEFVKGIDIAEAYQEGFGNSSCMTGCSIKESLSLLALYVENPKKIKLAKYYYGTNQARALIWVVAENEIFIDRIYSNNPTINKEFLTEIKAVFKDKTIHFRNHNALPDGHETLEDFHIVLKRPSSHEYPFLDTFRYFTESNGNIIISNNYEDMCYICNCCNGQANEIEYCDDCREIISSGELHFLDTYNIAVCEYCLDNNYVSCDECNFTMKNEDIYYVSDNHSVCSDCRDEYYFYCETCDTWQEKAKSQYVESSNLDVCNYCLEEHYEQCFECGEYYLSDDLTSAKNNEREYYVCDSCLDEKYLLCSICEEYYPNNLIFDFLGNTYCGKCENTLYEKQPKVA